MTMTDAERVVDANMHDDIRIVRTAVRATVWETVRALFRM